MTASPHFFENMKKEKTAKDGAKKFDKWFKKNEKFLIDTFGKKNMVRTYIHFDEKTPHLHAFVIPEKDGKFEC